MMRNLATVAAVVLIGAAMPALGQQNTAGSEQQIVNELAKKWETAFNRHDAASVASFYTEDAIRVTPEGVLQGRDAIRKEQEAMAKAGGHDMIITNTIVKASGDMIWHAGEWSATIGDKPFHGYYTNTLTREGQIKYSTYNMSSPAPAQPSAGK